MRGTEISLYSTLFTLVRGRGVYFLVNREIWLELRSESRSDALPATTIDYFGIRTHDSPHANRVFQPRWLPHTDLLYESSIICRRAFFDSMSLLPSAIPTASSLGTGSADTTSISFPSASDTNLPFLYFYKSTGVSWYEIATLILTNKGASYVLRGYSHMLHPWHEYTDRQSTGRQTVISRSN